METSGILVTKLTTGIARGKKRGESSRRTAQFGAVLGGQIGLKLNGSGLSFHGRVGIVNLLRAIIFLLLVA